MQSEALDSSSRRSRRGDSLTETERKIARLVAEGRTNREVAEQLAVSPKTIEWTLTRVYRKLGLRSRVELAARYGRGYPLGPDDSEDKPFGPLPDE
jgi:DNA-binding CsgD family transcriptional regulator